MYNLSKRIFDVIASLCVIICFLPIFIIISFWILIDSKGGVFYSQIRVGKNGREFKLLKFRSMTVGADKSGQLTIGNDSRVTSSGKFIRRFKIDEFPQLLNIIAGDMSVVGPRPEVPKYVQYYSEEEMKVLSVRPGLTDYASIDYLDEQKILGAAADPEDSYIKKVLPAKLKLSLQYVEEKKFLLDLKLIFRTISKIVS